jgi:hypothetical protein
VVAAEDANGGGLACSIWAKKPHHAALFDFKGNVVDGQECTVPFGQIPNLNHRFRPETPEGRDSLCLAIPLPEERLAPKPGRAKRIFALQFVWTTDPAGKAVQLPNPDAADERN